MRIFFDTEFTQFRDGDLLSLGFVSDDDREFIVEVHDSARHRRASEFCQTVVIPQFGTLKAHVVNSDAEAGAVVAYWLAAFNQPLTLCYDYKLDWRFLESSLRAAGAFERLNPSISAFNVADVANLATCLQAQEDYFLGKTRPGRHHPLIDALALRERWREYARVERANSAA